MVQTIYDKGTRIWTKDEHKRWKAAVVLTADDDDIKAEDEESRVEYNLKVKDKPFLCNPMILQDVDDLTELSYLHEPAVLHTLRTRYENQEIYTYCGIVLVAMNPFASLDIYSKEHSMLYRGKSQGELQPHIFALAENAFNLMLEREQNSSIVISGESGAGKTVSAKYCMRYFAVVGGSGGENTMESRVLASNPIMEAFGNAKTTRNNNSSRFGKYIAIQFEKKHHSITGALVYTYLLEKSRVVFQAEEERSYHIFYQLCAAFYETNDPELEGMGLKHCMEFNYINQGDAPLVDRMDDAEEFRETNKSLTICGVDDEKRISLWKLVAAILHIGNITIGKSKGDEAQLKDDDPALVQASELMGIEAKDLTKWLTKALIVAGKDTLQKNMSSGQALAARDAFAKWIYASVFDWLVTQVNKSLEAPGHKGCFIGVLDIYGFEVFKVNSFEQFCINYANEKLQQQFNQHVFKLEQDEYVREGIEWTFIDFYDNKPCIEMIEDKLGVLAILDEEARLPKGSNTSFLTKLETQHKTKEHFEVPRFGNGDAFIIKHFTCKVEYAIDGFLEKNKDAVSEQLSGLLEASTIPFVAQLFPAKKATKETASAAGAKKHTASTVASKFKASLGNLMATITATAPHYCRCIKPNQAKAAFEFEEESSLEQLQACGVLETVRISAAGYPSRWEFSEFRDRYQRLLSKKQLGNGNLEDTCKTIVQTVIGDPDKYQYGKTKIYFRAGQVAHLEKLRETKRLAAAIMLQKIARGRIGRKRYIQQQTSTLTCQRVIRGFIARRKVQRMRELRATIRLQTAVRAWLARTRYAKLRADIIIVQSLVRAFQAKKLYQNLKASDSATKIQTIWRGHRAHKAFVKDMRGVIIVQNLWRAKVARRIHRNLKMEAKDLGALKQKNWGLENKIVSQQTKIDEMRKELKALKESIADDNEVTKTIQTDDAEEKERMAHELAVVKAELEEAKNLQAEKQATIADLQAAAAALVASHKVELENVAAQNSQIAEKNEELNARTVAAEDDLEKAKKRFAKQQKRDANMQKLAIGPAAAVTAAESTEEPISPVPQRRESVVEEPVAEAPSTAEAQTEPMRDEPEPEALVAAPRPVPTTSDVQTVIEYTTDPQLVAEVAALKERVAELEGINNGLEETISEMRDEAESYPTSLLQATEGNSERLVLENKELKEEIQALERQIQRLQQQPNNDANLGRHHSAVVVHKELEDDRDPAQATLSRQASGVLQSSHEDYIGGDGGSDIHVTDIADPGVGANEPVGMFIFEEKDERALVQDLIVNVDPSELLDSRPHGIIAYILFMCLRWADHMNNPRQLQSLLTNSISSIKHVATKNHNRVDLVSFWICNSFVLLNAMKYSEEIQDEPHEYEMENFDLAEYRTVLEDLVSQMYLALIKSVQEKLSGMVSAAILEHDMLPNVEGSRHARKKYNAGSSKTVTDVIAVLQEVYDTLLSYGVDLHIVQQMFMQLLYFISANCLNNLLLRKDLCNWSKGLQIQYNVSQIEAWLRDHKLDEAKSKLACISQATKLLQMPKQSQDDVSKILEACTELNYMQIQKILSMYAPDTSDERVPVHVIRAVESVGRKRDYKESSKESNKKPSLMLDLTQIKQALILHVVPDQALCDVEIPEKLNVGFLRKATYSDLMED